MSPTDAPPVLEPPTFKLPLYAWLAWLPGAVLVGWLAYLGSRGDYAYRSGYILGSVVGSLFLPMLAAWIAWRLSGRKGRNHGPVFVVVLGLVVLGQVTQKLQNRERQAAVTQFTQTVRKNEEEMRSMLTSDKGMSPDQAVKLLNQTTASLKTLGENTQGDERGQALGGQAFLQHAQQIQGRYATATGRLQLDTFFDMDRMADPAARAAAQAAVTEFLASCVELRAFVEQGATLMENELRKQNVSARGIRETMAGYHQTADPRRPLLLGIRETDEALGRVLGDFLRFAEKYEGQWSKNPETKALVLPDDAAVQQYNDLMQTVQRIGTEQADFQRQLGRVGR